ncbi:MAG TPA: vWA domain-containing protein, partial [Thermoanaerobaculia bacterium]|nr:vWA domain-containing protein [Thermoanaerobaculia bacterium]
MRRPFALLIVMSFAAAAVPARAQQSATPLPRQDIVFVVDNSLSMEQQPMPSDPLRLRGVAASLVLDAAELSSDVQAGLVVFSGDISVEHKLSVPDEIRHLLQPGHLPPAGGGTNMYAALQVALSMFGGSTATWKRIVLITDGVPDGDQAHTIVSELVPLAQRSGIRIFALGVSKQIDQRFLDLVTLPTGGKTLVSEHHQTLLRRAKELMGNQDNVSVVAEPALSSDQREYQFTIRPG